MKIPKPTNEDKERFRSLVPDAPEVEVKPMFGNLGAFVNGNMFMGLFGSDVGVRLPEEQRQRVVADGGTAFGPAERPMKDYVSLPAGWTDRRTRTWTRKAHDHVAAMPPKKPKR
ncbi:MAG: TfoX/Sxy family protein [Actinobacteria bacterium]|nr:TfoX/Sxy family protein [Actinomycetota bacterium]